MTKGIKVLLLVVVLFFVMGTSPRLVEAHPHNPNIETLPECESITPVAHFPEDVNWEDFNAKVSNYFSVGEVTEKDRRRIPQTNKVKWNVIRLANELDKVRCYWGAPIYVTSWYRPARINSMVGGVRGSQHIKGSAADIRPDISRIYKFQSWLDKGLWKNRALGYGARKGFVHVDLREGGIRWGY